MRILKIVLVAMLFCATAFSTVSPVEAAIRNLRQGLMGDKVRIVVDADGKCLGRQIVVGNRLILPLTTKVNKKFTVIGSDPILNKATIEPYQDYCRLVLTFNFPVPEYKITHLHNPYRMVIDFPRKGVFKYERRIAEGVSYCYEGRFTNSGVPIKTHLVVAKPESGATLVPLFNHDNDIKKAPLSAMTSWKDLAAVNASYFDGEVWVVGNLLVNGQFVSSEKRRRTALVIDKRGKVKIVPKLVYKGSVKRFDGKEMDVSAVNRMRLTNELIVYEEHYGGRTGTNPHGLEVEVERGRATKISRLGNMIIRPHTVVLSGHGKGAKFLSGIKLGQLVRVKQGYNVAEVNKARYVIGAGPLLVQEGEEMVLDYIEEFPSDITVGRAPRTAVGLKRDGTILLLVVDGRSTTSAGMTLREVAQYLIKQGAQTAMNFDGGGSSEMLVKGSLVNDPSDGNERLIRVGLGLRKR